MHIMGRAAVITGASSGIGRALAVELGIRGATVLLAARSLDKLAETSAILNGYGIRHSTFQLDLTSATSIEQFLEYLTAHVPVIDVFVNNAAVGLFEATVTSSAEDVATVFQTNLWGPLRLMQAIVPRLQGGTLINISSAASKYAPAQQGVYAASKAALERLTEAIGVEETNLRTMIVVPDRTATPFMENVLGSREKTKLGLKLRFATPARVATRIADALEKDKSVCYTTLKAHIYTVLSAVSPALVKYIIRKTA